MSSQDHASVFIWWYCAYSADCSSGPVRPSYAEFNSGLRIAMHPMGGLVRAPHGTSDPIVDEGSIESNQGNDGGGVKCLIKQKSDMLIERPHSIAQAHYNRHEAATDSPSSDNKRSRR